MATSGTYSTTFEIADLVEDAFERCGIDPALLTGRHARSARRSLDLMFAEWGNKGIRLWCVDEQTQGVTANDPTYTVASGTLAILDMYVRRSGLDTEVYPMARDEYAFIPDKTVTGLPSRYWLDRATGIYTLWQTPENSTDVIHYYRVRRIQDVGGQAYNADVPYLWTEALVAGLAPKLAEKYAPEKEAGLLVKGMQAFSLARGEDRERTPTRLRMRLRG